MNVCLIPLMVPVMRYFGLFLTVCLLAGGCASSRIEPNGRVTRIQADSMPAPAGADLRAGRPYYLGPLDLLSIGVVGMDDLNQQDIQVDASGRINFPMVGSIEAAGKTPAEVAGLIEQGLRARHVRDPQVSVNLRKTESQVVTVDGEVREVGTYPVVGRMSLLRAVAAAKGPTEYAKLDDVVVLRTVDGKNYAALYNLRAIRQGAYEDPEIYANDVVIVGNSSARRLFQNFLSIVPLLTTPLILLLQ